jgi:hypothetical protein
MTDKAPPGNLTDVSCTRVPQAETAPPNPLLAEYQEALRTSPNVVRRELTLDGKTYQQTSVSTRKGTYESQKYPDGTLAISDEINYQTDYYAADEKTRTHLDWIARGPGSQIRTIEANLDDHGKINTEVVLSYPNSQAYLDSPDYPSIGGYYTLDATGAITSCKPLIEPTKPTDQR